MRKTFCRSVVGAGVFLAFFQAPAMATTISFTTAAVAQHNPTGTLVPDAYFVQARDTHSAPPSASSAADAHSGDWGAAGGMASANLATGELKGQVYGNLTGLGVYAYNNIYSQTNAFFGDGFRTTAGGSPFVWTGSTQAQFNITVDGSLTASPNVESTGGAWVTLLMFQAGTLDPAHVFGQQPTMIGYYHYLLGNPNLQVFSYGTGGPDDFIELIPTAYFPMTSGSATITQDITPGSDFDWVLLLGAYGNANNPGDSFDFDMAHTVSFSYQGPAGTSTTSASGLFTSFQETGDTPVPEPASMVLLGTGLAALAIRLRKQRSSASR